MLMFVTIKRSPKARLLGHNYKSLWLLTVTPKKNQQQKQLFQRACISRFVNKRTEHIRNWVVAGFDDTAAVAVVHQTLLNKLFDANSNWKFARSVLGFDARVQGKIYETHNRIETTTTTAITAAAAASQVAVAKKNTHIHIELEMIWKSTKSIMRWKCIVYEMPPHQQFSNFQVLLLMMMVVLLLLLLLLLYDRTCFALIVNRLLCDIINQYDSFLLNIPQNSGVKTFSFMKQNVNTDIKCNDRNKKSTHTHTCTYRCFEA